MQNIRLSPEAAYALHEKLQELLDAIEYSDIKDVQIRAGDDIKEPLDEVEVHLTMCSVIDESGRERVRRAMKAHAATG